MPLISGQIMQTVDSRHDSFDLAIMQAEKKLIGKGNKEYLPIQGLASFNKATADLLLGFDSEVAKQVMLNSSVHLSVLHEAQAFKAICIQRPRKPP